MFRKIGWLFIIFGALSIVGELLGIQIPTARWPFNTSREIGILHAKDFLKDGSIFAWFGWLLALIMIAVGVIFVISHPKGAAQSPIITRRIERFKAIRRGYISLWIVIIVAGISSLDQVIVGNKPLAIKYKGEWSFPAFQQGSKLGSDFGLTGEDGAKPANYRLLDKKFENEDDGNICWMPLVPYKPTQDDIKFPVVELEIRDGVVYGKGSKKPYDGWAAHLYDKNEPTRFHLRSRYRKGLKDGPTEAKNKENNLVYRADYIKGKMKPGSENWNGLGDMKEFLASVDTPLSEVLYFPTRPSLNTGHILGTDSQGNDLVAYLFGGLQVNFKAAIFYIPVVYLIGISIGLLMGYFGGKFDLIVQRVIEVFSNIPFLFIVIIASSAVPEKQKGQWGLGIILGILILFGWMGMTYLMRTAAMKEKARDYVAASKVIGASTPRIIFKNILPNTMAILVTLVPFSVSGLIMALTSLDYLGFGLPNKYATWGTLLRDGLDNLSSPWMVSSVFVCLVTLLILITFIGEAIREAFDPKKYTYYK